MWRTNLKVLALTVGMLAFYTGVARIIPQLESEVPEALAFAGDVTPEALVAAGERLYSGAGGCTACHGLGTRAPNLLTDDGGRGTIGARCGSARPGLDCKAYLHESLVSPAAYVVPGFGNIMPDMRRQLGDDQIWALVAYLQSQGGEVTVTAADVGSSTEGAAGGAAAAPAGGGAPTPSATMEPMALIREKGCIGCHVVAGEGGAVGPPFDGIGARLTSDRIRRAILAPNADTAKGFEQFAGMMPAVYGDQLSAAQLEALVQFLAARR